MFWTILSILSLVVLGGFLSYYGDLQGRRWGKKRVSLFGLRPKHTAILITSITGSVISLLSVITVLIAFPPIRDVILRGERAIRDNRDLLSRMEEQKSLSDAQLKDQKMATATIGAQRDLSLQDLSQKRQELETAQKVLKERQKQLARFENKIVALQVDIGKGNDKTRGLSRQKINLEKQISVLDRKKKNLSLEKVALARDNARAAESNNDFAKQNLAFARENLFLEKQKTELTLNNRSLITQNEEINSNNRVYKESNLRLLADLQGNEDKKRQLQDEIKGLQGRISVISRQMQELEIGTEDALRLAGTLRSRRLVTRSGETFARRTIDAHSRPEAIQNELLSLLEEASAKSILRGGGRGPNGRAIIAVGVNQRVLAGTQTDIERATLNALVREITAFSTPVLVTATAIANTVEGEQMPVELSAIPVTRTFRKGDLIATTQVDGGLPGGEIADVIIRFLQHEVREAALRGGTQPQSDRFIGTQEVGTLLPAELVTLTERIRKLKGQVQLTALASENLTTADPLRLTFRVERAKKN